MNETCPSCQGSLKIKKYLDGNTAEMRCDKCHKSFKVTYEESERCFPRNITKFNWGAFLAWHLWGFANGQSLIAILGWILSFFSNIFPLIWLIYLGISIYLGFNGNRMSWEGKTWDSIDAFEKSQRRWTIFGMIMLFASIIYFLTIVLA